jgi:hypothetical protein
MFLWVEEDKDIVKLSLVYNEGDALDVFPSEDDGNSTVNPDKNKNDSASPEGNNVLIWVLVGACVLVVLGAATFIILYVKKKNIKTSK